MSTESSTIVQRLWNYYNVLRDDGMSYGAYVEKRQSVVEELEQAIGVHLKRASRLRQEILKCVFEGKLIEEYL